MAARYDLRSPQDDDASAFAQLPGTAPSDAVPHNITELKTKAYNENTSPGCHPSRWIYEVLNNKLGTFNLSEKSQQYQVEAQVDLNHEHRLVVSGNQSYTTSSTKVLSSLCLDCHFHFVFKMSWAEQCADTLCNPIQARSPMKETLFPWHHLVLAASSSDEEIQEQRTKYFPILSRDQFVCVASPCTFELTVEVLEPRMKSWWVQMLLDHETIASELKAARDREPSRYEGATDAWIYQAPLNLNTYLKNLIESAPGDLRSISKRNKRFAVLFGTRSFPIFRDLEFSETESIQDGIDDGQFTPRAPELPSGPNGATEFNTYRAYIEDVRSEVQCIIHRPGQGQGANEKPTIVTPALYVDLGCKDAPGAKGHALVDVERYKLLGVLPNLPREAIINAYYRQWDVLRDQRKALVNSLVAVANDHTDESLSEFAMTQSSLYQSFVEQLEAAQDNPLNNGLKFFGLSPPNRYSANDIIAAFRRTLMNRPSEASAARESLMTIAGASSDPEYQTRLIMESDSNMSLDTSKAVFDISPDEEMESSGWIQLGRKKLNSSKTREEKVLYLSALNTIADHADDARLKAAAAEMQTRFVPSNENDDADQGPVNTDIPVGLNNIGNTCYLNSLLQYLFTVKAVRDVVINFTDYQLELTDEQIAERKIGGNKMTMDRAEAVVAQAFVHELADLFGQLRTHRYTATRPSQRLANAVLLSTHTLLEDLKAKEVLNSPQPPPLPTRPTSASPRMVTGDTEMASATESSTQDSDTISNGSSQTLVDLVEDEPQKPLSEGQTPFSSETIEPNQTTTKDVGELVPESESNAPVIEVKDTVNAESSQADIVMGGSVQETESIDQKVLNALGHQKRSSGTDQQDVEEVIGSIINRLQAAIRPSAIDEKTGIQFEKIMETFFVTTVNYTRKFDDNSYQSEISYDRSITAFPAPDGTCSLYDALGRNFDQQVLEDSRLARYTAIKNLPPVLHVLIQRSQSIGRKNDNPVIIPETLHLDRYMDAPHASPEFKRRIEQWSVGERLADLRQQSQRLNADPKTGAMMDYIAEKYAQEKGNTTTVISDAQAALASLDQDFSFDGPVDYDYVKLSKDGEDIRMEETTRETENDELQVPVDMENVENVTRALLEAEIEEHENRLQELVSSQEQYPYRLQAVICHRGHLTSGHYWVWIHDFEANVWRWYNDATVKENANTQEVLETLSKSGEPYYLCYVRDSDKQDYVDVPKREPAPAPEAEESVANTESTVQADNELDGRVGTIDTSGSKWSPDSVDYVAPN